LRQQFVHAMKESGVHLKLHQGTEVNDVVLWLKTPTELAWSTDLTSFPPLVNVVVSHHPCVKLLYPSTFM